MSTDIDRTRDFFAPRAAGWEERFPDDGPAFEAAVAALQPPAGGVALDAGCGTGRALPALRRAVGEAGLVIGVDLTPEMLAEAVRKGRQAVAGLLLGDASDLPIPDGRAAAVLAAGLISHLDDPAHALRELARVTRPGGRLALFHPISRTALAARHGRTRPDPDDVRDETRIRPLLEQAGWQTDLVDDGPDRYLVIATRI